MRVQELVGHNIRSLREGAGLTLGELAEAMRVLGFPSWVRQTATEVEAGRRDTTIEEAVALAAFFEMPLYAILVAPGSQLPTQQVEVGTREIGVGSWLRFLEWTGRPDEPPKEEIREAVWRAITDLTKGTDRPWARRWRRRGGHPAGAFHEAWRKLTAERRPYPGPTFIYEGERMLKQNYNIGPWQQEVSFRLEPRRPYVARNDDEAKRLGALADDPRSPVRKITRQEAYRLRDPGRKKRGARQEG